MLTTFYAAFASDLAPGVLPTVGAVTAVVCGDVWCSVERPEWETRTVTEDVTSWRRVELMRGSQG